MKNMFKNKAILAVIALLVLGFTAPVLADADVIVPQTNVVIDAPDGNNGWYKSSPVVNFNVEDADTDPSLVQTFYCIDSDQTCTPNQTNLPFNLDEGTTYLTFFSTDGTNIEVTQHTGPYNIDSEASFGGSISLNGGNAYSTDGNVIAELNSPTDATSGVNSCELSWDNGATWIPVTGPTMSGAGLVDEGPVIAQYRCADEAGNVSVPLTAEIIVDTSIPGITLVGDAVVNLTVGDLFTDPGTAIDDPTVTVIVGGDVVNTAVVGTYIITYNATDAAGNIAAEVTRTVNVSAAAVIPPVEPPPAPSSSGGGSSGGSGGFIIRPTVPVAGQVLGAFAINPQILEEFFALLLGRPILAKPQLTGQVLGAFTPNPMISILEALAKILHGQSR